MRRKFRIAGGTVQIWNRRHFLKTAAAVSAATVAASRASAETGRNVFALTSEKEPAQRIAANDHIQIALIGAGGQGMYDTGEAVQVPGVKLVHSRPAITTRFLPARILMQSSSVLRITGISRLPLTP
jgi:TAT (twin-arginine translocation) pathway signal sequence